MSRYYGIASSSGAKISLANGNAGDAGSIIFKKQPKMEKSANVAGGSDGTTQVRKSGVGEY